MSLHVHCMKIKSRKKLYLDQQDTYKSLVVLGIVERTLFLRKISIENNFMESCSFYMQETRWYSSCSISVRIPDKQQKHFMDPKVLIQQ